MSNGKKRAPVDPVFVLCAARSGSTLLRFLLDAHPQLACPPESDLPALCTHQAAVWSVLERAPMPGRRGEQPLVSDAARTGIRQGAEQMIRPYLGRRGKARYCDKSLGTAQHAKLLREIFPEATFICLYRHPMDVIASGIEACPWGLTGYGFDSYAAYSPGNTVLALARFWADYTAAIAAAEEQFPDRCHRVRYEDLVADPEGTADGIFRFLGVSSAPGITTSCFAPERERSGPADYKIWHTSQITADSVGRGWTIPASLITSPVIEQINELAGKLGYVRVDEKWSASDTVPDLRLSPNGPAEPAASVKDTRQLSPAYLLLGEQLRAGLSRTGQRFTHRWEPCSTESFLVIGTSPDSAAPARWRVDLTARTITLADAPPADADADASAAWHIIGPAETWERVIHGTTNLNVALRRRELRYCDTADDPSITVTRVSMLADLLGTTSWQPA
jgi:hypothetical protein